MGLKLFSSKNHSLHDNTTQSADGLFSQLNSFADMYGFHVFEQCTVYHGSDSDTPQLLLFDPNHGLYLFDAVEWDYPYLENATVSPALNPNTLHDVNVDHSNAFISHKLDAMLHHNRSPIVNFLHLNRLKQAEFESLDASFHHLLPRSRLIFSDDTAEMIKEKLSAALPAQQTPLDTDSMLTALFFQYAILPDTLHTHTLLMSDEQRSYIDYELTDRTLLHGTYGSGKSTLLLMKAIIQKLNDPATTITILEQSHASCEFLKQRLLQVIEFAMLTLDPLSIEIITPEQFVSKNHAVDALFCDDAHLLSKNMVEHLERIQARHALHFASVDEHTVAYKPISLTLSYRCPERINCYCNGEEPSGSDETLHIEHANSYIYTLHLLPKLLDENSADQILIAVPDWEFAEKLKAEIEGFLPITATVFNADEHILYQNVDQLLITHLEHTNGLQRDYVIVITTDTQDKTSPWLCHALSRAHKTAYLITDNEINKENRT